MTADLVVVRRAAPARNIFSAILSTIHCHGDIHSCTETMKPVVTKLFATWWICALKNSRSRFLVFRYAGGINMSDHTGLKEQAAMPAEMASNS